jgi:hypothetical protein
MNPATAVPQPVIVKTSSILNRNPAVASSPRTVWSWALLVVAAPTAAEVWPGWVGGGPDDRIGDGVADPRDLALAACGHLSHPPGRVRLCHP